MISGQTVPPVTLAGRLFAPVDIRFLVFFRIYFAAMMLWTLWDDFFVNNRIAYLYIQPPFHFSYHGFSWVKPWPGSGMYVHFAVLAVASACVLAGFLYRLSALVLALAFTYVFLLEKAIYLNHYYLMCLLCFVLAVTPAQRAWSLDARLWPALKSDTVPAWTLWLLRFQVALPYVFGGIAKLNGDWLQGQPMQLWVSRSVWEVLFGAVAKEHWVGLAFSWGGLVFDLAIVPLLQWPRTRGVAFAAAVLFHLMNAFMFNIGMFPWLMIGATTVFFNPDWPKRLLPSPSGRGAGGEGEAPKAPSAPPSTPTSLAMGEGSKRARTILQVALAAYAVIHIVLPFRHFLYPGNSLWTEEGNLFTWHMMLRDKKTLLQIVVTDSATGKSTAADYSRWLTELQFKSMGESPEMLREFAEFLGKKHKSDGQDVSVRVHAWCSLNGRKPQLLIDPSVDLSRQPRRWGHQPFILPLREPFRRDPFDVPVKDWPAHLQ